MKRKILVALLTIIMTGEIVSAHGLNDEQIKNAKVVADIATREWDDCGILPSVAVCQALNESSLGDNVSDYNWWGVKHDGERVSCYTLSDGIYTYFDVFKLSRYNVRWIKDHDIQVRRILKGGYCPDDGYYDDMVSLYYQYNLEKYNKKLYKILEERERRYIDEVESKSLNEWSNSRSKRLKEIEKQR